MLHYIAKTMANIYVKLGWPEYQAYQQFDGFDEHSHYCPEDEVYFIEQDWLMEQDGHNEEQPDTTLVIDYKDGQIELSSRYIGMDVPFWAKNKKPIHHHKVTIKIGYHKHTFDYWSGLGHYQYSTTMTDQAMIEAFDSFLSDCISANQSIDDFQSEFGYENVSDCIRTYKACKEELEAWKNFFIDPYDLDNWLRETYDL